MKKLILLFAMLANMPRLFCQDICDPLAQDAVNNYQIPNGSVWLKDFTFHLDKGMGPSQMEQRITILLSRKTIFKFVIKNSGNFKGKVKFSLEDANNYLLFSKVVDNDSKPFAYDFLCDVTCPYHISVTSLNGEEVCLAAAVYFVKTIDKESEYFGENSWPSQIKPKFQGGDMFTFMDYIQKNLKFPALTKLDKDILIVRVNFKIDDKGKVISAKAQNGENYKPFAEEAERVVLSSPPDWSITDLSNSPNFYMTVPVVFRK